MRNSRMNEAERSQWLLILEAAAGGRSDQLDEHWVWLMDELRLPYEYLPAVVETISQGRWRTSEDPRAYVKVVASREARKMGLLAETHDDIIELVSAPRNGEPFSMEATLDYYAEFSDTVEAVKRADGVWRRGGGIDYEREYEEREDENRITMRNLVAQGLVTLHEPSPEFVTATDEINRGTDEYHIHLTPRYWPNWDKWAETARFDRWDRLVLDCKRRKISRDEAMAEQPDEASRKAIQAAWRKFDRNGMDRLRAVIKKVNPQNVPESRIRHTR